MNDSLNLVTFIHRCDPATVAGSNIAMYAYDYSKNRGNTWTNNVGNITNNNTSKTKTFAVVFLRRLFITVPAIQYQTVLTWFMQEHGTITILGAVKCAVVVKWVVL